MTPSSHQELKGRYHDSITGKGKEYMEELGKKVNA